MEHVIKITRSTKTNAEGLAACIGVSRQRVQQLVQEGVLTRVDNGKYSIADNIQRFINYKTGGDGAVSYDEERALHEQTKRRMSEITLAKIERRMHDANDVELVMTDMLANLRTQLLGMPSTLSGELAGKTQEEIYVIMTKAMESKLSELVDYSPSLFDNEELEEDDNEDR
ncbi:MAG: hypothetical protein H6Q73_3447 [Firmicutes bacterium]|nr:hypothetical protein [Bacillota bacterium]